MNTVNYLNTKTENDEMDISFIVMIGDEEHSCGIVYDINSTKINIKERYIRYNDENGEEVYFNEF